MSITTTVRNGEIVLPPGVDWPDGTVVRVEQVKTPRPSVWEVLKKYDGIADNLPSDMAANHDDYRPATLLLNLLPNPGLVS